ncbi:hypothetical protein [Nocardia sp. NBC_01327]|uniref:hypothetical protein n=1 Tax=Nocardia sp. NBC_01327 TaxID=2903593 RepID=UPI002E0DE9F4|nr:hypothetical protein OG326_27550 [Nocardia sp. NBC_01327]
MHNFDLQRKSCQPLAIALPLIWLAWLIATEWIPMRPLNDLTPGNVRPRLLAASINYPFPLAIAGGIALGQTWSLWTAFGLCMLILAGHLTSWWLPYFGISSAAQRDIYVRDYSRTLKILPTAGHSVVPDVQHMIVGALTVAMIAATVVQTLG